MPQTRWQHLDTPLFQDRNAWHEQTVTTQSPGLHLFPSLSLLVLSLTFVPLYPLLQGGSDPVTPPSQRTTAPLHHRHYLHPAFVLWQYSCREAANPVAMFQGKPQQPSTSLQQGRTLVDTVFDIDEIPFS
jgi:hypothetical protein